MSNEDTYTHPPRYCEIATAALADADGQADGCYDLHGEKGPPAVIGEAIAASLRGVDLGTKDGGTVDAGGTVTLHVSIRFRREEKFDVDQWRAVRSEYEEE